MIKYKKSKTWSLRIKLKWLKAQMAWLMYQARLRKSRQSRTKIPVRWSKSNYLLYHLKELMILASHWRVMIKRHIFSHHYQVSKVKLNNFRKSTRSMELQLMTAILGDLLLTSQCVSVNSCFPKTIEILSTRANKAFKITLTTHHNLVLLSVCNKSKNFQLNHQLEVKKDLGTKV